MHLYQLVAGNMANIIQLCHFCCADIPDICVSCRAREHSMYDARHTMCHFFAHVSLSYRLLSLLQLVALGRVQQLVMLYKTAKHDRACLQILLKKQK